jgi:hypothetical protein
MKKYLSTSNILFSILIGICLFPSLSLALTQTFNDVTENDWYYDYVEFLVDEGAVDKGENFRPNDNLNRVELVKMVIVMINGLSDYATPTAPTFDDVPANTWFHDYVEAAVQLGIVSGYTDVSGNLTGNFGPSDTVNRAQAAKIIVEAFAMPITLSPPSIFPDVLPGIWFYNYVITAYNLSVLDGYGDGNFGPADPVTRAQIAKMITNAANPVIIR